ncbi:MFS transporter [Candidatus Mycobacterium wuenschmannii]|uniref:MFS transporter n=2 Tax=Candidatus Mycobacterium wuenschmannii TaxID=3027808 RepID=A0ABY8W310_9MYCO|nr:MFS transporter [Candidatus Mycobacterium wuenschmannii]WIM90283.1 MFS transporter [Candidatus Mycobacterium wuenschmannii]
MMVGFFMILLDSTIVAVANPSIMVKLGTGYDTVIWVTSAYLLAYAVPLLVAGRLGDRYGPKNLYLIGLAIFTAASLWCGLSGTIGMLITARVAQGIGAAVMSPQTLSLISRIFPVEGRGVAMSVWGATAGVATLVGPLAGGVLVDAMGWAWIFFVNVPIGLVGLGLAYWKIPELPTHKHRFDVVGVALSGIGMFLIVFSLQEGQSHNWAPWIWAVLVAGVGFMSAFVYWQSISRHEPLIPLDIFRDRDFSLCNAAAVVIAFAATGMILPLMFYAQAVCGLSPTRSALLTAPMAITSGVLAPVAGRLVDRVHPRPVVGFGFSCLTVGLTWLSIAITPTTPIWALVLPFFVLGSAMAFIWAPITATATRNLPPEFAGASSGVFNATRQVGAVLGSAGMASFMTSRIANALGPMPDGGAGPPGAAGASLEMPDFLHRPFADAMSQSMLLPAFVALLGVVAAIFLVGSDGSAAESRRGVAAADGAGAPGRRVRVRPSTPEGFASDFDGYRDGFDDDDDYVEYTLPPAPGRQRPDPSTRPTPPRPVDPMTEPFTAHQEPPRARLLGDDVTATTEIEPIRDSPNGFRGVEFPPLERRRGQPDEPSFDDILDTYGGSSTHDTGRNGHHPPPRRRRIDPGEGPRRR